MVLACFWRIGFVAKEYEKKYKEVNGLADQDLDRFCKGEYRNVFFFFVLDRKGEEGRFVHGLNDR